MALYLSYFIPAFFFLYTLSKSEVQDFQVLRYVYIYTINFIYFHFIDYLLFIWLIAEGLCFVLV